LAGKREGAKIGHDDGPGPSHRSVQAALRRSRRRRFLSEEAAALGALYIGYVLEAILRNNEVWFSNPLFMNDMEEVLFGINVGANLFVSSSEIETSCGTKRRSRESARERKGFGGQSKRD
jgi:hypothetical protein